jgi:hypothetical protein
MSLSPHRLRIVERPADAGLQPLPVVETLARRPVGGE